MTKTVTLDKSRDYGTIHPPHEGAYYHQGGFYFDHDGKLVENLMTDEQRQKIRRSLPAPPSGQGNPANTTTTEATGNDGSAGDDSTAGNGDGETGPNLTAWLKGEEEIKTRDVQDLIKARYGKVCTKLTDMVEFLVIEQKVVEVSELKPEFAAMFSKQNG
jgi:hypothetical protein